MPTKDGKWRLASIAVLAVVGTLAAACSVLSLSKGGLALAGRRKRRLQTDVSPTETRLQQLTRYRAADGTHSIRGTLLAEFELGVRDATLHVAFCPPFERLPSVEAETIDDSSATVKLPQLLHNGVQLEVRLSRPFTEKQTVTIEFVAIEPPPVASS